MRRKWVPLALMVLSLSGTVFAGILNAGQDTASVNSLQNQTYESYSLGEMVVSSSAQSGEAVGTLARITAVDIENSGARTLDEALDLIPGVYVRIGGAGTPRIDIRGFRTRHVMLLMDGVPFNSTYDGQFDPTAISVENIAEIKVITGGASVLYGQGGNGGVINIVTKKGVKGVHGTVLGEAGSENARIGRFSFSGATDKLDTFISGSIYDKDGFPLSDDFKETTDENGGSRENSDFFRKNLNANIGFSPNDQTLFGFTYGHQEGDNGIPGIVNYNKNDPFTKKIKFDRVDDMEGNDAQIAFSRKTLSPFGIRGWLYVNQQDLTENRYDDNAYAAQTVNGAYSQDSTAKIFGGNVQLAYDAHQWGTATLALMTETDQWEADGFLINKGKADPIKADEDYKIHSTAFEYNVMPVDRLHLVLGYGYFMLKRDEGSDENQHSWLLGADYDLFEKTRLKGSYARKVRFPSISQFYDVSGGNPDLDAETSDHYEAGITQGICGNTSLSFTMFRINAENFIEKDASDVFRNFQEYRFTGFEVAMETRPTDGLTLRASYSLLHSKDESKGTQQEELQHRPENKYALEATYLFGFGLTVHGDILRVADQYFYDSDNKDPLLKKELNDYTLVNLKLSQRLYKEMVEAYIGADNLMDEDYEQSYGLPQAGRTLYGGMIYRF
jgi:vitamin B12 transporter